MQLAWLADSWKESYRLNLIWGYLYSALHPNAPSFVGVALLTKEKQQSCFTWEHRFPAGDTDNDGSEKNA